MKSPMRVDVPVSICPFGPVKLWKVKLPSWVLVPFHVPAGVVRFVKLKLPNWLLDPEKLPLLDVPFMYANGPSWVVVELALYPLEPVVLEKVKFPSLWVFVMYMLPSESVVVVVLIRGCPMVVEL